MTDPRLKTHEELKATRDARREVKLRAKLKAVNKERAEKKAESEGYDPDYLDWVRTQPCIISGLVTGQWMLQQESPTGRMRQVRVEAAHMKAGRTEGTDMTALPVDVVYHSSGHPESQHKMGIKSWAKHHKLDIPALIAAHRKRYALECAEKAREKEGKQ